MLRAFVRLSIKNHWLFLGLVLIIMWFTGEILGEHKEWSVIISFRTARQIHNLFSKFTFILLIGLFLDKLYLFLKSKGKI